jgi:hypothetical protein
MRRSARVHVSHGLDPFRTPGARNTQAPRAATPPCLSSSCLPTNIVAGSWGRRVDLRSFVRLRRDPIARERSIGGANAVF